MENRATPDETIGTPPSSEGGTGPHGMTGGHRDLLSEEIYLTRLKEQDRDLRDRSHSIRMALRAMLNQEGKALGDWLTLLALAGARQDLINSDLALALHDLVKIKGDGMRATKELAGDLRALVVLAQTKEGEVLLRPKSSVSSRIIIQPTPAAQPAAEGASASRIAKPANGIFAFWRYGLYALAAWGCWSLLSQALALPPH